MVRRRDLLLAALAPGESAWFSEVTQHVFGAVPSFQQQLSKGIPYWRSALDVMCGTDVYGSQGIAAGDIDNDGRDEIYVCQSGGLPNRLYKIGSDGKAVDLTEKAGVGVLDDTSSAMFIDTRNRGLQDLILLGSSGPMLFLNQGNGRFELVEKAFRFSRPPQGSFTGMAAADFDGDGLVDLYLCSYIYYQSEDQYRYPAPYHDAQNGPPNFLFRNRGEYFEDVTVESGLDENNNRYSFAAAWCDADGDGKQELYVANDFGRNNYYRWDGQRFRDVAAEAGLEDIGPGMSAAWFDFDGDGRFDLYVANMYSEPGQRIVGQKQMAPTDAYRRHSKGNSLYRNRGEGKFQETGMAEMGRWAWSADGMDFDHDGRPELYIACGMITGDQPRDRHEFFWDQVVTKTGREYEEGWNAINQAIREGESWCGGEVNVFYANEGGKLVDRSAQSGMAVANDSRAFAFTDVDGDGHVDVVLKSRLGPQVRVFRNERGVKKPVMAVRLRGVESNRDAIGAIVRAGEQVQQVSAGSGYLSQHTKTLYFAPSPVIEIQWPSGRKQRVAGLAAGIRHEVTEGKASVTRTPLAARRPWKEGGVEGMNQPQDVSFGLVEPLPFPERIQSAGEKGILGKYLRDWRRPLPAGAVFHVNAKGALTDVQIGEKRAQGALPFAGQYIVPPKRNLIKLGAAFFLEKMPDAALVYLNDALQLQPNADAANGLGLMFARQGRLEEARDWFQKAITLDRAHAGAINNLGVLYAERRQWNDAIAAFEYGISVAPDDESMYLNLGRVLIQNGQRERARATMERLLERKPDSRIARRALDEIR